MRKLLNPIIIFCLSLCFSLVLADNEDDIQNFGRCITPNQERAFCMYLEQCNQLFDLLRSSDLRQEDKVFLSRSQCGYRNGKVLVCCPKEKEHVPPATVVENRKPGALPYPGTCGNVLSNRIYGGNITKIDEFPWMALIEYTKGEGKKGHHCGGSLINNRYVITASHCVNGRGLPQDWQLTAVRLGEWDTTTNPDCEIDARGEKDCAPPHIDVTVEKTIPHPEYNPSSRSQANDIALLRLADSVTYTDFIRPICLPLDPNVQRLNLDEVAMDVSGWGRTETAAVSSLKLKAIVAGNSLDECRKVYKAQNIDIGEKQICAGGELGVDSCRGDSGGPLVGLDTTSKVRVYYFLAGVVSFGPTPCGLRGWPGVYTKVSSYVDWIKQTIEA